MINTKSLILIIITLIFFSDLIYSQNSYFQKSPYKFSYGDSLTWKEPDYIDYSWQILYDDYIGNQNQYCWIRTNIFLSTNDYDYKDLVLLLDISAEYEIYWNGVKFGQNFSGDFENITTKGNYSESFLFNNSLVFLQNNTLAIRARLNKDHPLNIGYMSIADKVGIKITEYRVFGHLFFLMLIYVVLLILFLKYFKRHTSFFLTVFLSFIIILMLVSLFVEYLFFSGFVSYSFSYVGENLIEILIYLTLFSFSVFFVEFNKVKYGKWYLLLIGSILIISYFLELEENYYLAFGFLAPLLIVSFSYEQKTFYKLYSITFLFTIIIFLKSGMNLSLINLPFIIVLFYMSLIYLRNENQKKAELYLDKLRATRLETEMLKKIIQPHYIMNSLNSVIEWIEESPTEGLKFIKELSDEFRSFSNFSHKKSISIREELDLCKNHLKIMEYRHHKRYKLDIKIKNLDRQIPPAILHTLIENGITHHQPSSDEICFRIEDCVSDKGLELKIIVDYFNKCKDFKLDKETRKINRVISGDDDIIEGNGLKYIRSRLTESYGKKWDLNYYGDETVWVTNIKIYSTDLL